MHLVHLVEVRILAVGVAVTEEKAELRSYPPLVAGS
jgi:hypothetical protein